MSRRRDHPFAHSGLKIVSVALAVLLWMMVSSQRASVERGLRIPLELQNLPENLEMVEPPQESVDVRVRGTADPLGRLVTGDLVAAVDLSAAQPGRRLFHLSPERVKAPFAVEVTQVLPSVGRHPLRAVGHAHRAGRAVGRRRAGARVHRGKNFCGSRHGGNRRT